MSKSINAQMLEYIETTGEALAASEKLAQAEVARHEKIASVLPSAVEKLIESKLVTPEEKQAALDELSTHEGALAVIGNLADYVRKQAVKHASELQNQGAGIPDTSRPDASDRANYIGRRRGSDDTSPAWAAFEQRMGF